MAQVIEEKMQEVSSVVVIVNKEQLWGYQDYEIFIVT